MLNLKHSVPNKLVLIGASTGGPGQIQKIIESLDILEDTTFIIAQHMVDGFLESFAKRLHDGSHNNISVVSDGEALQQGKIYICDAKTSLDFKNFSFIKTKSSINSYNPDINYLFHSFIPMCKKHKVLCVILTGIGDDGVDACRDLSLNGARCMTESLESAIVDGMPNRARSVVPNIEVDNMSKIIEKINEFCNV